MGPVLKNGVMKVFVRSCRGSSDDLKDQVKPVSHVESSARMKHWENILRRMKDGIYKNAAFALGLHTMSLAASKRCFTAKTN